MAPGGCNGRGRGAGAGDDVCGGAEARASRLTQPRKAPVDARARKWFAKNLLLVATVSSVVAGVLLGFILRQFDLGSDAIMLVSYPGELVMRLLKLLILPLIIASMVSGAARLNASMNGKMAVRMLVYFLLTSLLNAALGTLLVLTIRPGEGTLRTDGPGRATSRDVRILDSFLDLGRNIFTDNLFQAAFQQAYTAYVPSAVPAFNETEPVADTPLVRTVRYRDGTNTLGIIFFCLMFGTVLGHMGSKAHAVLDFFTTLDEAMMRIVGAVMWMTPLGIASVVCGKVLAVPDVALILRMLGWFVFTVTLGVLIYQLVLMQLIYFAVLRRNPYRFYWQMAPAMLTAFATASTAAALPVTLRCMDREARIDPRVSRFVLPIGCTINMDGTALFVAVASGFLVQLSGGSFGFGDGVTLCLTAMAASFSSASVPSAALVLIFMVLATLDAPVHDVPLLFTVDWLVDRIRTTNNMLGDCYTAAVVERLSRKELEAADEVAGPRAGAGLASLASDVSGPLLSEHSRRGGRRSDTSDAEDSDVPVAVVVHATAPNTPPAAAPSAVVVPQPIGNGDVRYP